MTSPRVAVSPRARCLRRVTAILATSITLAIGSGAAHAAGWAYVCPVPGSTRVSPANAIAFRDGRPIDQASLPAIRVLALGTTSGTHAGRLELSDDRRTVLFTPEQPFAPGERVTVAVTPGLRTIQGDALPALSFGFTTSTVDPGARRATTMARLGLPSTTETTTTRAPRASATGTAAEVLPLDYIPVTVSYFDRPEPGAIFVAPFGGEPVGRLEIVDNYGQPLFYRRLPHPALDFRRMPSGRLVYHDGGQYVALDSTYAPVDSFATANGYGTDLHDMIELSDGHALLMSYDYEPYAMDTVVAGGRKNATVIGAIIQEIDAAKHVVFQWRSWDHFLITDADTCMVNLRDSLVDYVHINAFEVDTDGNLLVSSRHLSEITKISRATGEVLWRMGGRARRNQFAFVGDTRAFSAQHDIRRMPNGRVTLFDNGNCATPRVSRGVEYQLDEANRVATRTWEYRNAPDVYGPFMGNVQRLPAGGSMIGWGGTGVSPKVTEVHADGTPALQLGWPYGGQWTYRAFKFPWATSRFSVPAAIDFGLVPVGQVATRPLAVHNRMATPLTITAFTATDPAITTDTTLPVVVPPFGDATLTVRFTAASLFNMAATCYVRSATQTELVAQPVVLTALGQGPALALNGLSVTEGNTGTRVFGFQVTPTPAPQSDVIVQYRTVDGSAKAADNDYVAATGSLTIPAGATAVMVPVTVTGDVRAEADETFYVELLNPAGGTLGSPIGIGVILNDDGPLAVDGAALPVEFALHAAEPAPVHDHATVRFDLPRPARVRIAAFDVRGRRIETLLDADRVAGRHVMRWSPKQPDGVYFLRMDADGVQRVQRIVLLR